METAVDLGRIDLHYLDVREPWGYDPHPEHGVRPCSVASFFIMQASAARHADATRGMVAASPRHRFSADETGTNGSSAAVGADGGRGTTEHARRWVDRGSRGRKRSGAGAAVQEEVMEDPDELMEEVTVAQSIIKYKAIQPVAGGEVAVGMEILDGEWEVLLNALLGGIRGAVLSPPPGKRHLSVIGSARTVELVAWGDCASGDGVDANAANQSGGSSTGREFGSEHDRVRGGMHGGEHDGVRGGMHGGEHDGVRGGMHGGKHDGVRGGMHGGKHDRLRGGMRGGVRDGMYGDVHGGVGDGMHGGVHSVVSSGVCMVACMLACQLACMVVCVVT
ncbi:unnamed protein product [Closterium sp. Naga37s-1]|nr:unnamed protein product [Closterium sp. Naga37s-1]